MNDLQTMVKESKELDGNSLFENEKWYSIEELAKETGYDDETLSKGDTPLNRFGFDFKVESKIQNVGGHKNIKVYSQKVLDALQVYKRQAVVNQGNRSVEQKIEIGKELSIGFLTKTVIESGDNKSAEELCNLIMHNTQETANNKKLAEQIAAQKPKVIAFDNLVDRNHLLNFRDTAKELNMSQTEFMNILKTKYIYKSSSGEYRAYAEYSKYFTIRPFDKGNATGNQLLLNMKGLAFFTDKYKNSQNKVTA